MNQRVSRFCLVLPLGVVVTLGSMLQQASGQGQPGTNVIPLRPLAALSTVPVPTDPNLKAYIYSNPAAVALGKALFWDMQAGSDGVQACATCHFHAGADSRTKNQSSPGLNRVAGTQFAINAAINPSQLTPNRDATFDTPGVNGQLTLAQWERLHAAIEEVLGAGIDAQGATIDDFRHVDGARGSFQDRFLVHRRAGEPCPVCGQPVRKIVAAGRGTYVCERCQPRPRRRPRVPTR